KAYFLHQKPAGYGIRKIKCIHNPNLTITFVSSLQNIDQEAAKPLFSPKWQEENLTPQRKHVIDRWQKLTAEFFPIEIQMHDRTDRVLRAKVLPLWHGSTEEKCVSICSTGFTYFGKVDYKQSTDFGYFGSGIYFTDSARYATMYSNGHLLL